MTLVHHEKNLISYKLENKLLSLGEKKPQTHKNLNNADNPA